MRNSVGAIRLGNKHTAHTRTFISASLLVPIAATIILVGCSRNKAADAASPVNRIVKEGTSGQAAEALKRITDGYFQDMLVNKIIIEGTAADAVAAFSGGKVGIFYPEEGLVGKIVREGTPSQAAEALKYVKEGKSQRVLTDKIVHEGTATDAVAAFSGGNLRIWYPEDGLAGKIVREGTPSQAAEALKYVKDGYSKRVLEQKVADGVLSNKG